MEYNKQHIVNAECNLEPLKCPKCKKTENTLYNQYGNFCSCEDCGAEW